MTEPANVVQFPRRPKMGLGLIITEFRIVSPGATGEYVKQLQQQLHAWGFTPGAFDGIYGPKTKAAVTELQKVLRVTADGIFGPNTVTAVTSDLSQLRSILRDREEQFLTRLPPAPAPVPSASGGAGSGSPATGAGSGSTAIVRSPSPSTSVTPVQVTPAQAAQEGGGGALPWAWIGVAALGVIGLVAMFWPSGGGRGVSGAGDRIPGDDYLDMKDPELELEPPEDDPEDFDSGIPPSAKKKPKRKRKKPHRLDKDGFFDDEKDEE